MAIEYLSPVLDQLSALTIADMAGRGTWQGDRINELIANPGQNRFLLNEEITCPGLAKQKFRMEGCPVGVEPPNDSRSKEILGRMVGISYTWPPSGLAGMQRRATF